MFEARRDMAMTIAVIGASRAIHGAVIGAPDDAAREKPLGATMNDLDVSNAAPFDVTWARTQDDVREAQRLRWLVFAGEMGARLQVPRGTPPGHDADRFDDFCEHLICGANSAA